MFTDELKEGLVPVFGENVLVGRNEVLLVQRKNNLESFLGFFFPHRDVLLLIWARMNGK